MTDPSQIDTEHLKPLETEFLQAITLKEAGKIDEAEQVLRSILKTEPRLPEPRMELARILLDTERLSDAEEHAVTALADLQKSGPWTKMLEDDVVLALCHALLAETLRRRADEDDVIFGDPEGFQDLVKRSQSHFATAARLDPSDETSSYYALFFGKPETDQEPQG